MLSKKLIKDIQSLDHKKQRDELKLFVAEGPKIVNELLIDAPDAVQDIYATAKWIENHPEVDRVTMVSDIELEKISFLKTPHEVLAVVKHFPSENPLVDSFILYLDKIQDPGNFGTIIRIADWFGIKSVVCSPDCVDIYNPKVVQATMASIARVNVFYDEQRNWLQNVKTNIYAASLSGRTIYNEEKRETGVLIIGNESKGISEELLKLATHKITIPRKGNAESLNAAVATGIILSHLIVS